MALPDIGPVTELVFGSILVIVMPRKPYIETWLDLLEENIAKRPFTAKQAYECIIDAPLKKGKRKRQMVPSGTYSLARKMLGTKRVKRVGQIRSRADGFSDSGGNVALYDFV